MDGLEKSETTRRISLLVGLGVACAAFMVLFLVLWKYVPSRAAVFASSAEPLPILTRLVIYLSLIMIRYLPFVIVFGGPICGLLGVGAILVVVLAPRRPQLARRIMIGLVALACIELAASALMAYAMQGGR